MNVIIYKKDFNLVLVSTLKINKIIQLGVQNVTCKCSKLLILENESLANELKSNQFHFRAKA